MAQQAGPSTAPVAIAVSKRKIADAIGTLDDAFRAPASKRTAIAKGKACVTAWMVRSTAC